VPLCAKATAGPIMTVAIASTISSSHLDISFSP
jgi:hypothetical protein